MAGTFYENDPNRLREQIESSFVHALGPGSLPTVKRTGDRSLRAMVCPHAGYMYSGPTAARAYHRLARDGTPKTFVIVGPNHTGLGTPVSAFAEGIWETPLGQALIDEELAKSICRNAGIIDLEDQAHRFEHSIEVQIPFLQYLFGKLSFVPICMGMQDLPTSIEVGKAIAEAVRDKDCLVIASSDMSHYETHGTASERDKLAIDAIMRLDENELQRVVEEQNVTMCGYGPVTAVIHSVKMLGNVTPEFLGYSTSGDITGDKHSVVGYLAVAISS